MNDEANNIMQLLVRFWPLRHQIEQNKVCSHIGIPRAIDEFHPQNQKT